MKESNDGFVRADQIDLKSLDEQLERHLSRVWTMEKNKTKDEESNLPTTTTTTTVTTTTTISGAGAGKSVFSPLKQRHDWEIDPSKLLIKSVIARGTFGTVHRGIYDGQDVAGWFPIFYLFIFKKKPIFVLYFSEHPIAHFLTFVVYSVLLYGLCLSLFWVDFVLVYLSFY